MKKRHFKIVLMAVVLSVATFSSEIGRAALSTPSTPVEGASVLLDRFLETDEGEERLLDFFKNLHKEEPKAEPAYIPYDFLCMAVVEAENSLNLRKEPSISADIVTVALRNEHLKVLGEITVKRLKWYHAVNESGVEGYVSSDFISFYEEAPAVQPTSTHYTGGTSVLQTGFTLQEDISRLPANVQTSLKSDYAANLNWCLASGYPTAEKEGNTTNQFSIIVYIQELYQNVIRVSKQYGLNGTLALAESGYEAATRVRDSLVEISGQTEDALFAEIVAGSAEAKKAQEEAERAKREAAEAAAEAERQRLAAEEAERQRAAAAAAAAAAEEQRRLEEAARIAAEAAAEAERQRQAAIEAQQRAAEAAALAAEQAQSEAIAIAHSEQQSCDPKGRALAEEAEKYVGWLPYVWGGNSLSAGADCSGFCYAIINKVLNPYGISVMRLTAGQFRTAGTEVPLDQIQPGDIVCYPSNTASGHVGIYIGNGIVVHEPTFDRFAEYGSLYMNTILTIRRFY